MNEAPERLSEYIDYEEVQLTMMKKSVAMLLTLTLLCSAAMAEIIPPIGMQQTGYQAVVLSKNVTVRASQNANSRSVTRLSFGNTFIAWPLGNGWVECYLSEEGELSGYVLESYILVDPSYIVIEESTPVYAWKATNAKRVGLISQGEKYPIIMTEDDWMLISLRGAAGWIKMTDANWGATTARMTATEAITRARTYLLSTNPYAGSQRVTSDVLRTYYTYAEYDSYTGEWLVTFDNRQGTKFEVSVDDASGNAWLPQHYQDVI